MSLFNILCCNSIPSKLVFSTSNWLKVARIYTRRIMAKMVELHMLRNFLNKVFIRPAMSIDLSTSIVSPTSNRKHTITTRYFTLPNPTTVRRIFINKIQEAFFYRKSSAREGIKGIYQLVHTPIIAYQGGDYNR